MSMEFLSHANMYIDGNSSGMFVPVSIFADHFLTKDEILEFEKMSRKQIESYYAAEKGYRIRGM